MPLDPKQRKIVQAGKQACAECGAWLADLRQRGYPNEALEVKHEAMTKFFEGGEDIVQQFDAENPMGRKHGA